MLGLLAMLGACTTAPPSPPFAPLPPVPPVQDAALRAERHRMTQLALTSWEAEVQRVYDVSQRMLAAATAKGWCGPRRTDHGLRIETISELPAGLAAEVRADVADAAFRPLRIIAAAPGSTAAAAGIERGSTLVAVNGEAVREGHWPVNAWAGDQAVELTIANAQGERHVRVASQTVCAVDVVMDASHELSAHTAAGGTIHVAQGMVQALQDDDSLAFVIGHELGHRAHADSALPRLLDAATSQDQERQADLFGLQLLAFAGYDPHRVADVWDRLARLDPDHVGQNWLRDHPLRAERSLRLREAIESLH